MREMTKTERKELEFEITEILQNAVSDEYARTILEYEDNITGNTFMDDIIDNIIETSAWEDEGYYNSSDIKFAIGRILIARLGIEI